MKKRSPSPCPTPTENRLSGRVSEVLFGMDSPHQMERDLRRNLLSQPKLKFSSLVIRRIDNGICLEGVMEAEDGGPDLCSLVQQVAGVERVINQVMVTKPQLPPAKG